MDEEFVSGLQDGGQGVVDEHQLKRKVGKIVIDDDSMINELNFCYSDA